MDRMSGPNISHPYTNRPRGYVRADEGPSDPQARLEYMLQRLQQAHHTDHAPYDSSGNDSAPYWLPISPIPESDEWTGDESQRQADVYGAWKRYARLAEPLPAARRPAP